MKTADQIVQDIGGKLMDAASENSRQYRRLVKHLAQGEMTASQRHLLIISLVHESFINGASRAMVILNEEMMDEERNRTDKGSETA